MITDKIFMKSKFGRKILIRFYSKTEKGVYRSKSLRILFKNFKGIEAGYASYGWTADTIDGPCKIGNYTSIGKNVRRISVNHLFNSATTHPCIFSPSFGWVDSDNRVRSHLNIGNDVWIGDNVIILPSVTYIGNGAIIAAGAVVSKNIPPYEIWGGVPARFIKNRFTAEIINGLEEIKWWDLPETELLKFRERFNSPQELIEAIKDK